MPAPVACWSGVGLQGFEGACQGYCPPFRGLLTGFNPSAMLCRELAILRRVIVNTAAFENLKRVLRTVPQGELRMECWDSCAIGYATQDPWFWRNRSGTAALCG